MDATAQRARDREAFREFLDKHRYAPQGRFARVGTLEEKDIDALTRGTLGPVWAWAWRNVKNAEDMEIVRRNVNVARYSIDSCKQEREQAKAKHETLEGRKKQLEEALHNAKEREKALLASLRGLEEEQDALVHSATDNKQRELLRKAFNEKNDNVMARLSGLIGQAHQFTTVSESLDSPTTNQIEILLAEVKRMLKTTKNAESVDFGDSDIDHLRNSSGADLLLWLLDTASRPHDDVADDEEDAKYVAHVEEHSSTSHDAIVQIQNLLRQSQAEHIASFVKTQKDYAKAAELKRRVEEATAPDDAQYGIWGDGNGGQNGNGDSKLAAETVDLQIQSQANAVALNLATRTYGDVVKQIGAHRQKKQELEHKIELMNQFEERQQDIVAQIRSKFRHNQELLQSLTRKQSRLLQIVSDETLPRIEQESGIQLSAWSEQVKNELLAFSSIRLSRHDSAQMPLVISQDAIVEHARNVETVVPFDEFYINQLRNFQAAEKSIVAQSHSQSQLNGYQRVAKALEVPAHASWAAIVANLQDTKHDNAPTAEEINRAIQQLERDMTEDRAQTIPEAQALLSTLQQVTDAMTSDSLSRLEEVIRVNMETLEGSIPELEQAIENWHSQPAWSARVESSSSAPRNPLSFVSEKMEISDLLR